LTWSPWPTRFHLGEIEGLEGAVEARVGFLDVESRARHASGHEMTTSSRRAGEEAA